ncbi:hypothetical protein AVEN_214683-1, partial [Araneus ventricosus]
TWVTLLALGTLNATRCNSSSIEAGVLIVITDYFPTLPQKVHTITGGSNSPLNITREARTEPAYLSGGFSSMHSRFPPGEMPDIYRKPCYPRHAETPGVLNDSSCNSSSTEAGVLVAHRRATARPLQKEVRTITGRR